MDKVIIAFATDLNFYYYTAVSLYSLLKHTSAQNEYELLILSESLPEKAQSIFFKLVENFENVSLHIIDMKRKIAELGSEKFYIGTYSIANYYRLFLHELFPQYDKILYLDSDIIIQKDIADLFYIDTENHAICAVKDRIATRYPLTMHQLEHYIYFRDVLQLKNPHKYFNSGVLLLSLDMLRNSDFSLRIRDKINSGMAFRLVDQDILNCIFDGNITYLDMTYNFMAREGDFIGNKAIVHLSGIHPWLSKMKPHAALWWNIAEETFFASDLHENCKSLRFVYLEDIETQYYIIIRSKKWRIIEFYYLLGQLKGYFIKYMKFFFFANKSS